MMNSKLKLAAMCAIAAAMFAGCEKSAETTLKSVADTRPRVKTCVVRTKKFAETAGNTFLQFENSAFFGIAHRNGAQVKHRV